MAQLIQLHFYKIMQTRAYTVVVLGTEEKQFAIYTEPTVGRTLQLTLTGTEPARPLTHDLISQLFDGYKIRVKQMVINDREESVFYARLFLEREEGEVRHIIEIDARPSDCITLALMHHAPVYCTREVLDNAIAIEEEP